VSIGLFCVSIGLFCAYMRQSDARHTWRFCVSIGLFCVSIGLFCVSMVSFVCLGSLLCFNRSLLCVYATI